MNNRTKILIAVIIVVIILVTATAIVAGIKRKDTRLGQKQDKKWEETREDITSINEESYFYGFNLLDAPPDDFEASANNSLPTPNVGEGRNRDSYYCSSYGGTYGITHISFSSVGANLFGICVGDEISTAETMMESKGFERNREENRMLEYRKNDITVRFVVSPDKLIEEIKISVVDPNEIPIDA